MKTRGRLIAAAVVIATIGACDAGKAPYQEAVALEEQRKLTDAADKYDAVCRRAPDSQLCPPSVARAASVRLKLADDAIKAFKFVDAEQLLKTVEASGDDDGKAKAKTVLTSKDLLEGARWQKALSAPDKRVAMKDMETVAASGASTSTKANEWLTKERPPLLLADATAVCSPNAGPDCPIACERLLKLHPGTPEATKATEYMKAYSAAEELRLYPLLVQAEGLIAQCQAWWKKNKAHDACILRQLGADPDNPIGALAACGEADTKAKDKLQESFDKVVSSLATPTFADALKDRFKKACEDGEYEKQVSVKPSTMPADASANTKPTAARKLPKGICRTKTDCDQGYDCSPTGMCIIQRWE